MVSLRNIRPEEIPEYRELFIRDYGEDLAINHGYSNKEGLKLAEKSFASSFPNNVTVSGDELLCIVAKERVVGYLWYSVDESEAKAFVCDFYVHELHRSKGYGKSAIELLEKLLCKQGVSYLGLRVANNNPRALELYKDIGFTVSGIQMSKRIHAPGIKI